MGEQVSKLVPATMKVTVGDVQIGDTVFVSPGKRGKYDVYRDGEGREFIGVCIRAEIDRSTDRMYLKHHSSTPGDE